MSPDYYLIADWRPPTLESSRLLLRAYEDSDTDAVFAYASNPNMTQYTLWETHKTKIDSLLYVRDYALTRYLEKVPEPLAVVLKVTGKLIGSVGCFWVSKTDRVMELGYNIAELYWGNGFAVEAAQTLLRYVFENYNVQRIQARVMIGNEASERVLDKLGFTCEGLLRSYLYRRETEIDVRLYALLHTDAVPWR